MYQRSRVISRKTMHPSYIRPSWLVTRTTTATPSTALSSSITSIPRHCRPIFRAAASAIAATAWSTRLFLLWETALTTSPLTTPKRSSRLRRGCSRSAAVSVQLQEAPHSSILHRWCTTASMRLKPPYSRVIMVWISLTLVRRQGGRQLYIPSLAGSLFRELYYLLNVSARLSSLPMRMIGSWSYSTRSSEWRRKSERTRAWSTGSRQI